MPVVYDKLGGNGVSYYDMESGKTIKGGKTERKNKETKKRKEFFSNIKPESQFIFGLRNFPTPAEMLIEGVADFSGNYRKKVNKEIEEHNKMVMERAKILTYAHNHGVKFEPRVQISGMGAGKFSKIAAPAVSTEIPPWFLLVPDGITLPDKNKQIGHMTQPEIAEYVSSGRYLHDLNHNRLDFESQTYLAEIYKVYLTNIADNSDDGDSSNGLVKERDSSENSTDLKHDEFDKPDEFKKNDPESIHYKEIKRKKLTRQEKFRILIKGQGFTIQQRKFIYKQPEVKKLLKDLDLESMTEEDKVELRETWKKKYPHKSDESDEGKMVVSDEGKRIGDDEVFFESHEGKMVESDKGKMVVFDEGKMVVSDEGKMVVSDEGKMVVSHEEDFTEHKIIPNNENEDEDEDEDEGDPPIPIQDEKKPRPYPIPDSHPDSNNKEGENSKKNKKVDKKIDEDNKVGLSRPLFNIGGQNILNITEAERLQEIKDWDLYNLVVPEQDDVDNPLHLKNIRDTNVRFYGVNNDYHPKHFYKQPIRKKYVENQRIISMRPVFIDIHERTKFNDPYNNQKFISPQPAYRTKESTSEEYNDRLQAYDDKTNLYGKEKPYPNQINRGISQIDLMLSLR